MICYYFSRGESRYSLHRHCTCNPFKVLKHKIQILKQNRTWILKKNLLWQFKKMDSSFMLSCRHNRWLLNIQRIPKNNHLWNSAKFLEDYWSQACSKVKLQYKLQNYKMLFCNFLHISYVLICYLIFISSLCDVLIWD